MVESTAYGPKSREWRLAVLIPRLVIDGHHTGRLVASSSGTDPRGSPRGSELTRWSLSPLVVGTVAEERDLEEGGGKHEVETKQFGWSMEKGSVHLCHE